MRLNIITTGTKLPEVILPDDHGNMVILNDLQPAPLVLFFYPRDMTSGCTQEAMDFSRLLPAFQALGARVFGISKDSVARHEKFVAKHDLTVPLLSDDTMDIAEKFGVWQEKRMYGKAFWGIVRSTFLIDGKGEVVREWRKVKVPGHAEEVLETVRGL